MKRWRILVRGIVQGVGFRPFVYGAALRHGLTGLVYNHSEGVTVEAQGVGIEEFVQTLRTMPPPLAVIDNLSVEEIAPLAESGFRIAESVSEAKQSTPISPDIATCDDCLRELFDPQDRRYRYSFINCTHCGPRFTIIRDIPYDRPNTTMAAFTMCAACEAEYHAPENRRFHAQPNACPACGPRVWLEGEPERAWEEAANEVLARGEILAIKGIGGFHLAVDATNEEAVARLRDRKGRRDKPFALMARDLEMLARYAELGDESALLASRQRPIVLLKKRGVLAPSVAPGNPMLGFMLPYSPLHHLLLRDKPLVMTSGNLSEEPIVWRNEDVKERLGHIADAFLLHDRDIHVPCDDSVVTREFPIRRSRGYSPMPVKLAVDRPMTLGVGAELKNCFCLTRERYGYMSQHIGDMENLETLDAFERALGHMRALFRCEPERVVCDLHPGYLSSRWAREYAMRKGLALQPVQHHHAHALAVMAEHGLGEDESVVAFTFDGTGYGTDGAIWGGEVLRVRYDGFERLAHLEYVPLLGGDAAIKHPARVALAHLWAAGIAWEGDFTPAELRVLRQQLATGSHSVPTSSMGRLFDAVAAFLGVRKTVSYEGQAAIELEALCEGGVEEGYPVSEFDVAPMWGEMVKDLKRGVSRGRIAARFHRTIGEVVVGYAKRAGEERVVLTGGVFQNRYLLRVTSDLLSQNGFRALTNQLVPPNDGGIALGQVVSLPR